MIERRKFISLFGLGGIATAVGAPSASADDMAPPSDQPNIILGKDKSGVALGVGRDGKLWIRNKNSEWARVVTE